MRKKGFTLVEMLAVIVIIGVILIVALPQIQNQLANKKEDVAEVTLQMIYSAAEDFTSADPSTFQKMYNDETNKAVYCITLKDLVDAGKLEAPITDYKNGKEYDLAMIVLATTNKYNEFEYNFTGKTVCDSNSTELVLYQDKTLKEGTYPTLYNGLIPVIYKNGNWVKASLYETWYSYANNTSGYKWANAVTVNAKASTCDKDCLDSIQKHNRSYYEKAVAGTKISRDDINGMFVWIPKFEYKVTSPYGTGTGISATSPGAIDVNFVEKTATTASSGYTIHSAFTYGNTKVGGFWAAKFEASAEPTSKCAEANDIENCNTSKIYLNVTPNRNSWRNISIGNAFDVSTNMSYNDSYYGLKSTQVDSHLMKNNEWGAIAYLSQSRYGRYGKDSKEIFASKYFNNGTLTGCTNGASGNGLSIINQCIDSKKNPLNYNYEASYSGSTSGTIYGIFDMSGGAWEYVMGNYNRKEGSGGIPLNDIYTEKLDNKGNKVQVITTEKINDKYVNIFTTKTCASGECSGHALLRTELNLSSNWWLDNYDFGVTDAEPWLIRGGSWELSSEQLGVFAVNKRSGEALSNVGFRPVITGN